MKKRDLQPELMDDPDLPEQDHRWALKGLARLNRFSGVEGLMFRAIRRIARSRADGKLSLLDVASGSGDVPIGWVRRAEKEGWRLDVTLVDNRQVACDEQQRLAGKVGVSVKSLQCDCLRETLPSGFNVVTSSLFFHHLNDSEVFQLLQAMQLASSGSMVLCDLERSKINFALVALASRCLTRSPVVHYDALASVRAAFTIDEFGSIARSALARPVRIQRAVPCRFLVTVDEVAAEERIPAFV